MNDSMTEIAALLQTMSKAQHKVFKKVAEGVSVKDEDYLDLTGWDKLWDWIPKVLDSMEQTWTSGGAGADGGGMTALYRLKVRSLEKVDAMSIVARTLERRLKTPAQMGVVVTGLDDTSVTCIVGIVVGAAPKDFWEPVVKVFSLMNTIADSVPVVPVVADAIPDLPEADEPEDPCCM